MMINMKSNSQNNFMIVNLNFEFRLIKWNKRAKNWKYFLNQRFFSFISSTQIRFQFQEAKPKGFLESFASS